MISDYSFNLIICWVIWSAAFGQLEMIIIFVGTKQNICLCIQQDDFNDHRHHASSLILPLIGLYITYLTLLFMAMLFVTIPLKFQINKKKEEIHRPRNV